MTKKQKKMLYRIIAALALVLVLKLLPPLPTSVELLLYCIPYLVVGWDVLRKALLGIKNRQPFDECFLMAVATVGAFALGDYVEGCAVIIFYQIGELFQGVAVGKSRRSISALMDIRPDYANIEGEDGKLEQVDPDEVEIGTIIVVQPGERVPIDGVIVEGASTLNTAALTGESLPRDVRSGDEVISGCVNMSGLLKVRTTKEFGESTVSKILDLVENSSMKKARAENFITRFARVYTPAVCYGALALAFIPPIVLLLMGQPARFGDWVYRALTFLVISCPCALVISIPLSFFGGIGGASACGILVKGSTYLEELADTRVVVFDKTGTLTQGSFKVVKVCPVEGGTEDSLVEAAALAESWSKHPISLSIKAAYGKDIDAARVTDVEELGGHGVTARVDGKPVAAGNARLMAKLGLTVPDVPQTGTIVHVAIDGKYAGYLLISDVVKPHSAQAIKGLKQAGVRKTVMLTGDAEPVAKAVSAELGIDEYHAGLLPGDKVDQIEKLLAAKNPKEGEKAGIGRRKPERRAPAGGQLGPAVVAVLRLQQVAGKPEIEPFFRRDASPVRVRVQQRLDVRRDHELRLEQAVHELGRQAGIDDFLIPDGDGQFAVPAEHRHGVAFQRVEEGIGGVAEALARFGLGRVEQGKLAHGAAFSGIHRFRSVVLHGHASVADERGEFALKRAELEFAEQGGGLLPVHRAHAHGVERE